MNTIVVVQTSGYHLPNAQYFPKELALLRMYKGDCVDSQVFTYKGAPVGERATVRYSNNQCNFNEYTGIYNAQDFGLHIQQFLHPGEAAYAFGPGQCKVFRRYVKTVHDLQAFYPSMPKCTDLCKTLPASNICTNPNHRGNKPVRCSGSVVLGFSFYHDKASKKLF
jgi:hypothetical protein